SFDYGGRVVSGTDTSRGFYDPEGRRLLRRDLAAEQAAADLLTELGLKFQSPNYYEKDPAWEIVSAKLPRIVRALVVAGWHIEADGKVFRRPGSHQMEISSGVDWFELHGEVNSGESTERLPELLAAVRR